VWLYNYDCSNSVIIVYGSTGYRLPTEAQWEYAAKGGNGSPGNYTYSGSNILDDVAWYKDNSGDETHEVGKKAPNGLGLYDMSGNVWEWCWDLYTDYHWPSGYPQIDPEGPSSSTSRMVRGGSWGDSAGFACSVYRSICDPIYGDSYSGFRLVRP